ncbi:hypothetical protein CI102_13066 [Trichoderma harzianum]|nr:hypothetical protein CI102_13066 [Trichoderma harzianum]
MQVHSYQGKKAIRPRWLWRTRTKIGFRTLQVLPVLIVSFPRGRGLGIVKKGWVWGIEAVSIALSLELKCLRLRDKISCNCISRQPCGSRDEVQEDNENELRKVLSTTYKRFTDKQLIC